MPIESTSSASVAQTSIQDSSAAEQVTQSGGAAATEQVSHASSNSVEQWSAPAIDATQVGDAAQSLLPALGSIAEKIFGGLDKAAVQDGTMSALSALGGGGEYGGLIQFGLKALTTLLSCQSPTDFLQAGIKLATDPNFPVVVEKMFDVCSHLAEGISAMA